MVKYKHLFNHVMPVLESKLEEMMFNGYEGITIEDIWNFCLQKKWRKRNMNEIRIFEIVETIFSLNASEIVSFFQIQQFQMANWFSEINQEELRELLKPSTNNSDKEK